MNVGFCVGHQVFAREAKRLAYMTEEAREVRNAFLEKENRIFLRLGGCYDFKLSIQTDY